MNDLQTYWKGGVGCKQTAYTHILHLYYRKRKIAKVTAGQHSISSSCVRPSRFPSCEHQVTVACYQTSRLPPHPTHALSTPSVAWKYNSEGTYTEKLAMARGPKYDDRSHSHCKCKSQDALSDRVWMYVDSEYHEVQRMERIV